jgi:hypothetical protein
MRKADESQGRGEQRRERQNRIFDQPEDDSSPPETNEPTVIVPNEVIERLYPGFFHRQMAPQAEP